MSYMNGDLSRAWKRLKKKNGWDDTDGIALGLRETMICLSPVPQGMAEEMAAFYLQNPVDDDAVYKSEEILEVLAGTWVSENSVLKEDDWDFLEEQVNSWAQDMDMDTVTEIMKAVVGSGRFREKW